MRPVLETEVAASYGDAADDPAIWVHPDDPAKSLVIGTDKQLGLYVFDLEGRAVQTLPDGSQVIERVEVTDLTEERVILTVLGPDRDEAVAAGWFGPLRDGYADRIGEVVVAMLGRSTLLDSRLLRPEVLALRGHHGSITDAETAIPLLVGQVGAGPLE